MTHPVAPPPGSSERPYGIVGDGSLARHFRHYLSLSGCASAGWSRREGRVTGATPAQALRDCPVVLLLISDDAIEPFVSAHPELQDRVLVHCAGGLVSPRARAMHPLMTFGPDLYDLGTYQAIPFVCEPGRPGFREVFPGLSNPAYVLNPADRPLYHSLCVLAGNLTPFLWEKLFTVFLHRFGLPREVAEPYFRQVVQVCQGPLPFPHSGPVTRGDRGAVARHLEALRGDPYRAVYEGFVRAVAPELLEPAR